jgi:hypothetical protein
MLKCCDLEAYVNFVASISLYKTVLLHGIAQGYINAIKIRSTHINALLGDIKTLKCQ